MDLLWRFLCSPSLLIVCVTFLCVSEAQVVIQDKNCTVEDCFCSRRLRLGNSSAGIIVDHYGGGNYKPNTQCLFYLETDRPMSSLRLKFNTFDLECCWDYLHVFSGDSIYSNKIAAFTGDLLPLETESGGEGEEQNSTNSTGGSGSGMGMGHGEVPISYREPHEIIFDSPGSSLLLYFISDTGVHKTGFNISYWANYTCPESCSGRGNCSEEEGVCVCDEGWSGEWCQVPSCPNDCFGNGECSVDSDGVYMCQCDNQYTGVDCSIPISLPRWNAFDTATHDNLTHDLLARASHSAVLCTMGGNYDIIIFGGYQFPTLSAGEDGGSSGSGEEEGEELVREVVTGPLLLQYSVSGRYWWEPKVNETAPSPSPRYGHSAVIYNDTMHIFGGVLIPGEKITNEHWALHIPTLTWSPLTLDDDNDDVMANSTMTSNNTTNVDFNTGVAMTMSNQVTLPIRVRSHTAHMVGTVMVVLFGVSDTQHSFLSFVQEYDMRSGEWSVPSQYGITPKGRMGHTSVYDEQTGLVYVYGGYFKDKVTNELLVYNPLTHYWSRRSSGPASLYFHTSVLFWGRLILVFGGSGSECFSDQLLVYNIGCDEWFETDYNGLPGNARRIGHIAFDDPSSSMKIFGGFLGVPLSDVFQIQTGDCSVHLSEVECASDPVFCSWVPATNTCLPLRDTPTSSSCFIDECLSLSSCEECLNGSNCTWSENDLTCRSGVPELNATCPSPTNHTDDEDCALFSDSCHGCMGHGCQWTGQKCVPLELNVTSVECSIPCSHTSCSDCASEGGCLWCPSLNQCFSAQSSHSFAYTYPFGQCLQYITNGNCPEPSCGSYVTCDDCYSRPECGWCRDPADNGLGTCSEGGFLQPLDDNTCSNDNWFFEECPACQCNGHSLCVNESVCEKCQNNTKGLNCETCADGYYGNAKGGGTCTECDCNGYDSSCDSDTGECTCHDIGVDGTRCDMCNVNGSTQYEGDADNFCYYKLSVGFVYTFQVTEDRQREVFFLTTPKDDTSLSFKFDIKYNPNDQDVLVQLFLGRKSEGFWVLANLTDQIRVKGQGQLSRDLDDSSGSRNGSNPPLFSFARPQLASDSNFTALFNDRSEHYYTSKMWNGDVALIVHVSNLTTPISYKITLDQTNLWFLLYFFATFIICFTGLLTAFMVGWYLKRKIEMRRYMRQQYRDLRRRVARPFSRIKLIIRRRYPSDKPLANQNASYVSAQTCKSGKAAILTSLIQLPGDTSNGRPGPGRTGLCLGTALVKVTKKSTKNHSSKKQGNGTGDRRRRGRRGEERGGDVVGIALTEGGMGETNGSLRERRHDHPPTNPTPSPSAVQTHTQ